MREGACAPRTPWRTCSTPRPRGWRSSPNRRMAERSQDVLDVERRLLRALAGRARGRARGTGGRRPPAVVVVAEDLTPIGDRRARGRAASRALVLEHGGVDEPHGDHREVARLPVRRRRRRASSRASRPAPRSGSTAPTGTVVVEPDAGDRARGARRAASATRRSSARSLAREPAARRDARRPRRRCSRTSSSRSRSRPPSSAAPRGSASTARSSSSTRPAGCPTEEEHVEAYREALERMGGRPAHGAHVRLRRRQGGARRPAPPEPNPALGVRSLRWCFAHPRGVPRRSCARSCAWPPRATSAIMLPMVGEPRGRAARARHARRPPRASSPREGLPAPRPTSRSA